MAEADAVRLLQAFGAKPRVVQRGAEMYFGTDDICFKRCNLNVDADGRVVEAWHDTHTPCTSAWACTSSCRDPWAT